jgi:hypothetical protein
LYCSQKKREKQFALLLGTEYLDVTILKVVDTDENCEIEDSESECRMRRIVSRSAHALGRNCVPLRPGANLIDANSTLPFSRCTKFGARRHLRSSRARFLYVRPHARVLRTPPDSFMARAPRYCYLFIRQLKFYLTLSPAAPAGAAAAHHLLASIFSLCSPKV